MKTYLFDFDGTLVDSMPSYTAAMLRILDEEGISYGPDIIKIITPLGLNGTAGTSWHSRVFYRLGRKPDKRGSYDENAAICIRCLLLPYSG